MPEVNEPIFVDLDPQTLLSAPTPYESMRAALIGLHPVSDGLPDEVRAALLAAVDYVALAYEQADAGRPHLFARLTGDGYLAAVRGSRLPCATGSGVATAPPLKGSSSRASRPGSCPARSGTGICGTSYVGGATRWHIADPSGRNTGWRQARSSGSSSTRSERCTRRKRAASENPEPVSSPPSSAGPATAGGDRWPSCRRRASATTAPSSNRCSTRSGCRAPGAAGPASAPTA